MKPRREIARRRRIALIAAGLLALLVGVAVGAGSSEDPSRRSALRPAARPAATPAPAATPDRTAVARARRMSLADRAGALVIMRFAGSPEPAYVRRALREGRASGVIVFRDNLPTAQAARAMARRLQRAARGVAIICTDQEGGPIRTMPYLAPDASQGRMRTPQAAATASRAAARGLRSVGVNVNLGPVVDVGSPGLLMRGRAFPGDPREVAAIGAAAVRAYRGTGVLPTIKHFPGLGAANANTDEKSVRLARSPAQLLASELVPFRAAIKAGAPLVMMSHAVYPALDGRRIASQSKAVVDRLLRGRLGFDGVVMTDSIEAAAVTALSGPGTAAVRSVRAGVDVVLTTGPGSHLRAVRALVAEARRSPAFERRVAESAARVLELRERLTAR